MGPRNAVLCVADACAPPTGAFGGAPYGATKRCTGCGEAETCEEQGQGGDGRKGEEERRGEEERGAPSLQNEDPTPQDCWEKRSPGGEQHEDWDKLSCSPSKDSFGKGLAFINFKTPEAASTFKASWHRSRRRLSMKDEAGNVIPLSVASASLQGQGANLRKWTSGRVNRVKRFLPFVIAATKPR